MEVKWAMEGWSELLDVLQESCLVRQSCLECKVVLWWDGRSFVEELACACRPVFVENH